MKQASHQTVKLAKGRHSSPAHGVCVMELASMLAGEPFTDHPRSVSRSIAAFMRGYNDLVDDRRRQELYAYASKAVGTAAPDAVEEKRAAQLLEWADGMWSRRARWSIFERLRQRSARVDRRRDPETAARWAIKSIRQVSNETHRAVLGLIDALIEFGGEQAPLEVEPAAQAGSRVLEHA